MPPKISKRSSPVAEAAEAAEEAELVGLESPVDLDGNAVPERLAFFPTRVDVQPAGANGEGCGAVRPGRSWPLRQINDARIVSSPGSHFVQVLVDGTWHDVLRRPGDADEHAAAVVERLRAVGHSGESLHAASTERAAAPSQKLSSRLVRLVRPYRGQIALLLVFSVVAVAIEVVPPLLQRFLVDEVLQASADAPLGWLLLAVVAGLLVVRLLAAIVTIVKGLLSTRVGTTLTAELRTALVERLNALPLAFHNRHQTGVLMSRVAYDTETLHTLVHHLTSGLLLQSLQLVGIGVMLFYLHPKLAAITMLPMPLIVAASWHFTRYLNPRHNHYWEAVGKQAAALTGMLSGIRVVKAFAQEQAEDERFRRSSFHLRDARQGLDVSTSAFNALMGLLFAAGMLAVWYVGGREVLAGRMSLGTLMAFLAYLAMFYTPLTTLAESTTWFSNFFTACRRIFDLLDEPAEKDAGGKESRVIEGRVEFDDVTFGYDKNRPVLRDVKLAIRAGEFVGVVGRSGSGKSTMVSLIGRLFEADAGEVRIDGRDVRSWPLAELRRQIGIVPQEPFLFRGTVAQNVRYGRPEATAEEILRAAHYADSHDFIVRMPLGYDTALGEGGAGLSGGERQRLSIARALLVDPPILILDEATASVDAESERAITRTLRRFARQRTTVAIAHRLSTLREADRLLVFDQGRLIEEGTHDELLARRGLYSTLFSLQANVQQGRRQYESLVGGRTAAEQLGGDGEWLAGTDEADGSEPSLDRTHLRWLEPAEVAIDEAAGGAVCVRLDGHRYDGAWAVRAFPATPADVWLSLRACDADGREFQIGMIRDLDGWPEPARRAVWRSLGRRYLWQTVKEIRQLRVQGPHLSLVLQTDLGIVRCSLDRPQEAVREFGDGLLLIDSAGNYFLLPDRESLPRGQRAMMRLYFGV